MTKDTPNGDEQRSDQDQHTIPDRSTNDSLDHGRLSGIASFEVAPVLLPVNRARTPLRLASESIRNCPEATTRCPSR